MPKYLAVKLYKYCNNFGLNIIRDKEIRLSQANEFNDPLELLPVIDDSEFTQERIETILRKPGYFEDWYNAEHKGKNIAKAMELYLASIPKIAADQRSRQRRGGLAPG